MDFFSLLVAYGWWLFALYCVAFAILVALTVRSTLRDFRATANGDGNGRTDAATNHNCDRHGDSTAGPSGVDETGLGAIRRSDDLGRAGGAAPDGGSLRSAEAAVK